MVGAHGAPVAWWSCKLLSTPAIMSWLMSIGKWSWLCSLVLRAFAECEVTRFRMQCAEVSAFVDQSTRCNMLNYGGANIVLDCETQGRDSTVVFRFSPLSSNSDRSSWHLVSTDDLRAQIAETEDAWLFAVMFKFGLQAVSDSGGHISAAWSGAPSSKGKRSGATSFNGIHWSSHPPCPAQHALCACLCKLQSMSLMVLGTCLGT